MLAILLPVVDTMICRTVQEEESDPVCNLRFLPICIHSAFYRERTIVFYFKELNSILRLNVQRIELSVLRRTKLNIVLVSSASRTLSFASISCVDDACQIKQQEPWHQRAMTSPSLGLRRHECDPVYVTSSILDPLTMDCILRVPNVPISLRGFLVSGVWAVHTPGTHRGRIKLSVSPRQAASARPRDRMALTTSCADDRSREGCRIGGRRGEGRKGSGHHVRPKRAISRSVIRSMIAISRVSLRVRRHGNNDNKSTKIILPDRFIDHLLEFINDTTGRGMHHRVKSRDTNMIDCWMLMRSMRMKISLIQFIILTINRSGSWH